MLTIPFFSLVYIISALALHARYSCSRVLLLHQVPHPSSDMAGLTVSRNKDKPENHYRINICTADRRNLLWEFVKALHELPLRVTNATISTKNGGKGVGEVVMDAFDVMMDEGSEWSASQLEAHLCDALEL